MTIKSVIILRAKNEFSRQILFCIELLFQLVEIAVDRPIRKLIMEVGGGGARL